MKSIPKIINEEIRSFLREVDEDIHDMYEARDNIVEEIYSDFLYANNQEFTKNISWQVVPYARLKKVWEDFMRMGSVQNINMIDNIERTIIRNVLRIDAITEIAGHTAGGDSDEVMEEHIGYWVDEQLRCHFNKPENPNQIQMDFPAEHKPDNRPCDEVHPLVTQLIEEHYNPENMDIGDIRGKIFDVMQDRLFEYYLTDPKSGHIYMSDYGLAAIMQLATQLYGEQNPEIKLQTIDKILNVVHQRSDLASWFIQGGSGALSDLSGYEVPDEEAGGYDTKSAISGRYKMSDYH